jgi:RNA polymerase sigma-70 factor (ECF subfamily)
MTPTSDPSEPEPDEELVRRVLAGDTAAGAALFDRHLPALRARVRRRLPESLRGKVGESDVIQEAWIAAYARLADFEDRGDGSFAKWLRGIVAHKLAYETRRHAGTAKRDARREARLPTDAGGAIPAMSQTSVSQGAIRDEQSANLRRVIGSLRPEHAETLRLVHLEGLTLAEAGKRMGRSAEAVRKIYGRALARLAERLRGAEAQEGADA